MPKYIIEREIHGVENFNVNQLKTISQTSCRVLNNMGPQIQWVQSFVATNKLYCIYIAPNKEAILEHARLGAFPSNVISEVTSIMEPITAEQ